MENSKYSVCPGCEALLMGDETDCPNCGTMLWSTEPGSVAASPHGTVEPESYSATGPYWEYGVYTALSAEDLAGLLNVLASQGWEPINVYGGTIEERPEETVHFAVMRRRRADR